MDGAIFLGLVVAVSTFLSPLLLAWMTNRNRQAERKQDFERQDLVAQWLLAANERVANSTHATNQKLDVVHALVNSNMTAAKQAERDATSREYHMMIEVIEMKRLAGHEPNLQSLAEIEATRLRLAELDAMLEDRTRI